MALAEPANVGRVSPMAPAVSGVSAGPPMRLLGHTLVLSAVVAVAVGLAVCMGLDGWTYYRAPLGERGYMPQHRLLRPSGMVGQGLGVIGFVLMLVPIAYAVRKRVERLRGAGSLKSWLEVHVFCGIVGPVLVSLHTSFKFGGLVSVAYWSMVLVALSGIVGRYLYVRIPRSLRGHELSRAEIDARMTALGERIAAAALPTRLLSEIEAFERVAVPVGIESHSWLRLAVGDLSLRRALARVRGTLAGQSHASLRADAVALVAERAFLLRRTAYLRKTKALFDLWHVFHMPLVYAMFAIVIVHVGATVYMGYVAFLP